jgi:branched-subunit amino acid transport protein AzlD
MTADVDPKYVITLVHGTAAPKSPWTMPNSQFRCVISQYLEGDVLYNRFEWSGSNQEKKRIKATEDLKLLIGKLISKHPKSHHFAIGHSHGGNIILDSLGREFDGRLSGVVCLNTPFINLQKRNLEKSFEFVFILLNLSIISFIFFMLVSAILKEGQTFPQFISDSAYYIAPYAFGLLFIFALRNVLKDTIRKLGILRDRFVHSRNIRRSIRETPVLSIYGAGDEVVDISLIGDAIVRLSYMFASYKSILFLFSIFFFLVYGWIRQDSEFSLAEIFLTVCLSSAFTLLSVLLMWIVGYILTLLLRILPHRMSFKHSLLFSFVVYTVGVIPLHVEKVRFRELSFGGGMLNHSDVHQSTRAMLMIASWIESVAASNGKSQYKRRDAR